MKDNFRAKRTVVDVSRNFPRHVTEREAWENLANAVIIQAVVDYQCLLLHRPPMYTSGRYCSDTLSETECEIFFKSEYFAQLTSIRGDFLIDYCRKRVREYETIQ